MANLTFTVPDSLVPTILSSFDHVDADTGDTISGTQQDVLRFLRTVLRNKVEDYEINQAAKAMAQEIAQRTDRI